MNLTRLFAIVTKELRQLRRDRLTFGMILGIPTLHLFGIDHKTLHFQAGTRRLALVENADARVVQKILA